MTKIVKDFLEDWTAGRANGFYDTRTDEIHILSGCDVELRSIWHEKTHAKRKDKTTFKLAKLASTPAFNNLLFFSILLAGLGVSAFGFFILVFFGLAGVWAFLLGCQAYEERQAILTVTQMTKNFKRSEYEGGETKK